MSFGSPYMTIPRVTYLRPSSIQEAVEMLEKYGDDAKVMAGGISIVAFMKERLTVAKYLVSLKGIKELNEIKSIGGQLHVGATVTLRRLEESSMVKQRGLFEAVSSIADPIIRQSATLVGNTCEAIPWVDAPPALISLGARAHIVGSKGTRELPSSELIKGTGQLALDNDEIITEMVIPENGGVSRYLKFTSGSEYSIASVAVRVDVANSKLFIVGGAVAETPRVFGESTVEWQWGDRLDRNIKRVWSAFDSSLNPMSDFLSSGEFRLRVSKILVAQALKDIFGGIVK